MKLYKSMEKDQLELQTSKGMFTSPIEFDFQFLLIPNEIQA